MDFLDTNVFVYAYDTAAPRAKQSTGRDWILIALSGPALTSMQVMCEFAATLLRKRAFSEDEVQRLLDSFSAIQKIQTDSRLIRRALDARREYGIHFYDSLIVAAAERAGCRRIITEDLNHGQSYFSVLAHNPFLEP